jgi:hypothetical protein
MTDEPSSYSPPSPQPSGYWVESRRPLCSLLFIAPLLAIYELGVIFLGPQAVRNGADVWLRIFLDAIGFGQYYLLPVLAVSVLLSWHYTTRQSWAVSPSVLWSMFVESVVLAFSLRLLLQIQGTVFPASFGVQASVPPPMFLVLAEKSRDFVGFLGAGVYEELLFRLILQSLAAWVILQWGCSRRASVAWAVIATSLTFAAAHYIGPYGEPVVLASKTFWFGFSFRFMAGAFFGTLFVFRGFGIAAGCHAGYDILVGMF